MTYCESCGASFDVVHDCPARAPELEPPRYCAQCGRRMVVQVTPRAWVARCVEHGERRG